MAEKTGCRAGSSKPTLGATLGLPKKNPSLEGWGSMITLVPAAGLETATRDYKSCGEIVPHYTLKYIYQYLSKA
jgi:hypothetical protein